MIPSGEVPMCISQQLKKRHKKPDNDNKSAPNTPSKKWKRAPPQVEPISKKIQLEQSENKNLEIEIDPPIQTNEEILKKYDDIYVFEPPSNHQPFETMLDILLK